MKLLVKLDYYNKTKDSIIMENVAITADLGNEGCDHPIPGCWL